MTPVARVLVADDEPSIRFVLRETLEAEGFEVTDVDNGEAALRGARRGAASSSPSSTSACPGPAASSCSSGCGRWAATPRS